MFGLYRICSVTRAGTGGGDCGRIRGQLRARWRLPDAAVVPGPRNSLGVPVPDHHSACCRRKYTPRGGHIQVVTVPSTMKNVKEDDAHNSKCR